MRAGWCSSRSRGRGLMPPHPLSAGAPWCQHVGCDLRLPHASTLAVTCLAVLCCLAWSALRDNGYATSSGVIAWSAV